MGDVCITPQAARAIAYTVTVTPGEALVDGQLFTVQVKGPPGMTVLSSGFCDPAMPTATNDRGLTEWCTDTVGNGQAGGFAPADPDGVAELNVRGRDRSGHARPRRRSAPRTTGAATPARRAGSRSSSRRPAGTPPSTCRRCSPTGRTTRPPGCGGTAPPIRSARRRPTA